MLSEAHIQSETTAVDFVVAELTAARRFDIALANHKAACAEHDAAIKALGVLEGAGDFDSPAHTEAEAAEGAACTACVAAWNRLMATPAPDLERVQLKLAEVHEDGAVLTPLDDDEGNAIQSIDGAVATIRVELAAAIAAQKTAPVIPEAWAAAVASYEAAKAHVLKLEASDKAELDALEAEAGLPAELKYRVPRTGAQVEEYWSDTAIMDDKRLTVAQREAMLAIWKEWRPRYDAARARIITDEDGEFYETARDALKDATFELLSLPAPNADALVQQIRVLITEGHATLDGERADDENTISRLLGEPIDAGEGVALIYRSALRLAGQDSPALRAAPFNASDWIEAFERIPGTFMDPSGPYWNDEGMEAGSHVEARKLFDGLSFWQKREVRQFAQARWQANVSSWVNRWENYGSIHMQDDGSMLLGGPVDDTEQRRELEAELDADPALLSGVRKYVRERGGHIPMFVHPRSAQAQTSEAAE